MLKRFYNPLLLLVFVLFSCSRFINMIDDKSFHVRDLDKNKFSLVFSHNINGETHPCGCRHHPLGGLPQVAGKMHQIQQTNDLLYVDSGDTFFPSSVLPPGLEESQTFGAKNLAKGLNMLGLKYHVPGDQDLSAGWELLEEIIEENDFLPLLANLKDKNKITHKKWAYMKKGPHRFFITGVVFPDILQGQYAKDFIGVSEGLNAVLAEMKEEGYDSKNELHRLIILSNGGIDNDTVLAKSFKQIDWIVGSHSQSFTNEPIVEGNTKIVQVLSRNHYLGEITFDLTGPKTKDSFQIHEMRDELKDELKPNPLSAFIDDHKEKFRKIQISEQSFGTENLSSGPVQKYATANSCIECHQAQGDFWQATPHAMAYTTLIKAKEDKNLTCIKCHSLGLGDKRGFNNSKDIVQFDKGEKILTSKEKEQQHANYWAQVSKAFGDIDSVRALSSKELYNHSQTWKKIDETHKVDKNFANVQCLNCHSKHPDHPFLTDEKTLSGNQKYNAMKKNCLSCHNKDQSPEWYEKQANTLPGKLNELHMVEMMKKVACPKIK